MLQEQKIWLLISLKLSGEASIEELEELEGFLTSDPELVQKLEMLKMVWGKSGLSSPEHAEKSLEKHLQRITSEHCKSKSFESSQPDLANHITLGERPKKYIRFWWAAAAASILIFWLLFQNNNEVSTKLVNNSVSTKPGFKATINLPDGSKVWLNGDSKLTYDGDFDGKIREVYLSGEAFFDIAKDENRPFIIQTKTINLKVLGTSFNVRSYDEDKETETSLVRGSVEITLNNNPDKKIVLKPGEKLLVKNALIDSLIKKSSPESGIEDEPIAVLTSMHYYGKDSSTVETSWTKSQLVFDNERLDKIALNMERWFKVKIIIKDENLKRDKFTLPINEEDELGDVLEALKTAENLHYSIKNNEVVIKR